MARSALSARACLGALATAVGLAGGCGSGAPNDPSPPHGTTVSAIESCLRVDMIASRAYPKGFFDATQTLSRTISFAIPPTIPVASGDAGNGELELTFSAPGQNPTHCTYRGGSHKRHPKTSTELSKAQHYVWQRCNTGAHPGDFRPANEFTLHVKSGDSRTGRRS